MADNWGGSGVEVREATLRGPDDAVVSMDFAVVGDGVWRTVSLPFHTKFQGTLRQIRLHPAVQAPHVRGTSHPNALRAGGAYGDGAYGGVGAGETEAVLGRSNPNAALRELDAPPPTKGNAFAVDWVRVVVAPTIMRVEGCQVTKNANGENKRERTKSK